MVLLELSRGFARAEPWIPGFRGREKKNIILSVMVQKILENIFVEVFLVVTSRKTRETLHAKYGLEFLNFTESDKTILFNYVVRHK